jgi:PASTA domain
MRHATAVGFVVVCSLLFAGASAAVSASTTARAKARWRGVEAVLPANAAPGENQDVSINSVSCASPGNCSAVGTYRDSSGNPVGLLLSEKAGKWRAGVEATPPAKAGATQGLAWLTSVSCASAGNCTAVGYYSDIYAGGGGDEQGLLLTERAGKWASGVNPALPTNADSRPFVQLNSVSCASAGNCTAVGSYEASSGVDEGLLLTEKAGKWAAAIEARLPSQGEGASLSSVSCAAAGYCSAVGESGQGGLLLTERAGEWRAGVQAALPRNALPDKPVSLTSVSCASPGNCSAVGTYNNDIGSKDSAPGDGVLLTEKAGKWQTGIKAVLPRNAVPSYSPDHQPELNSVSCPSAGSCVAVGTYEPGKGIEGLLLTEKAGKWRRGIEASGPHNADTDVLVELSSVSCASPGNCTAVDSFGGLLVSETAGRWTKGVKAALPPNAEFGASLTAVSCASPGGCTAAGQYGTSGREGLLVDRSAKPCVVPRLKGRSLSAAERSLASHGCSVGRIERVASRRIERDHVISQNPRPGRRLAPGAKVSLVVSNGKAGL